MPYAVLAGTDVSRWDQEYKQLEDSLPNLQAQAAKDARAKMESVATRAEERINRDMQTVRRYFADHTRLVGAHYAEAIQEVKRAQQIAASYKSNPSKTEYLPQLKVIAAKLANLHREADDDATDFGAAWAAYRTDILANIPEKYRQTYYALRSQTMNEQKPHAVKLERILAGQREVEALVKFAEKVRSKSDIKAGTSTQRHISAAIETARALEAELAGLLAGLRNPGDFSPKPNTVTSSSKQLVNQTKDKNWVKNAKNLTLTVASWKNVSTGYKLMVTRAGAMEKVLVHKKKAFRSNELSDANIKNFLAKAEQHVKAAQADAKAKDADFKAAKKAYEKLEAAFKAEAKKK